MPIYVQLWLLSFATLGAAVIGVSIAYRALGSDLGTEGVVQEIIIAVVASSLQALVIWAAVTLIGTPHLFHFILAAVVAGFVYLATHLEHMDRSGNVFHSVLAKVGEDYVKLVPDLIIRCARNTHTSWFAKSLQSRRDIHVIAEDVVLIDDNVSNIYSDPENDAIVDRNRGIAADHALLNGNRTLDGINNTGKLHKQAIACGFENPTILIGYYRINEGPAMGLQGRNGASLINADQAAVADNIGGKDGRKPAPNAFLDHARSPGHASDRSLRDVWAVGERIFNPDRFGSPAAGRPSDGGPAASG